jgi:hypothetical protein
MKKSPIFSAIIAASFASVLLLSGCNDANKPAQSSYTQQTTAQASAASAETEPATTSVVFSTTTANTAEYKAVYDDYCEELISKANVLASELAEETANNSSSANELVKEKTSELSVIYNEGLGEMVKIMENNQTSYDEYEYWANELLDIYESETDNLYDSADIYNSDDDEDLDY